jgi:predicted amino acid racemase
MTAPRIEVNLEKISHNATKLRELCLGRGIGITGAQDVLVAGLTPRTDVDILGASSNRILIDAKESDLEVGDEVELDLSYGALLSSMTSPYVASAYIDREEAPPAD